MSEVVLILAVGTAVLAILFGARVAVRTVAGGATQNRMVVRCLQRKDLARPTWPGSLRCRR